MSTCNNSIDKNFAMFIDKTISENTTIIISESERENEHQCLDLVDATYIAQSKSTGYYGDNAQKIFNQALKDNKSKQTRANYVRIIVKQYMLNLLPGEPIYNLYDAFSEFENDVCLRTRNYHTKQSCNTIIMAWHHWTEKRGIQKISDKQYYAPIVDYLGAKYGRDMGDYIGSILYLYCFETLEFKQKMMRILKPINNLIKLKQITIEELHNIDEQFVEYYNNKDNYNINKLLNKYVKFFGIRKEDSNDLYTALGIFIEHQFCFDD